MLHRARDSSAVRRIMIVKRTILRSAGCRVLMVGILCHGIGAAYGQGKPPEIRSQDLLAEALTAADQIEDFSRETEVVAQIAMAQARTGDLVGALKSARTGVPVTDRNPVYLTIAAAQAKAGDIKGAIATADAIPDYRSVAYASIIEAMAQRGDISGAKALLVRITDPDARTGALASISIGQATANDVPGACETAASIAGEGIDKVAAYTGIANAQSSAHDLPGALKTIALAKAAAKHVSAPVLPEAMSRIAASQVRAGDLTGAQETGSNTPNHYADPVIAVAQADTGDIAAAKASAQGITNAYERIFILSVIVVNESKAGNLSEARQTLDTAKAEAAKLTGTVQASSCNLIAQAQTKIGDAKGAVQWARSLKNPQSRVSALTGIAESLLAATAKRP